MKSKINFEKFLLKITFKNVGQGDCIFLEWCDDNVKKFGIIDCNREGVDEFEKNILLPILDYKEIEFIIITHPHYDHYSGILDIINYAESNNIKIKNIYHTLLFDPRYFSSLLKKKIKIQEILNSFSDTTPDKEDLEELLTKIDLLKNYYKVNVEPISFNYPIYSCKNLKMTCLSPKINKEYEKYFKSMFKVDKNITRKKVRNNYYANYISTIISLETNNGYFLLTSDATKYSFKRVHEEMHKGFSNDKLLYGLQIPHHGSPYNHNPTFWRKHLTDNSYAFLSVGLNDYDHPDLNVIKFFWAKAKEVYSTNNVNGYKEYYDIIKDNFNSSPIEYVMDFERPKDLLKVINSDIINSGRSPTNSDKVYWLNFENEHLAYSD